MLTSLTIKIEYSETNDGFMYDIYDTTDLEAIADGSVDSVDGGLCTTTLANALGMATQQAKALIKN